MNPPLLLPAALTIPRRRVLGSLIAATALLALAFVATHMLKLHGYPEQMGFRRLFNMDGEATLPAWFSSTLMLVASALLAIIAAGKQHSGDRFRSGWWILAAGFLYMSADEIASIHEMLNRAGLALPIAAEGRLDSPWVIFGMAAALAVGIGYLKFLAHLPAATRWRFVLAGACYLGGALGVEMQSAALADALRLQAQPLDWDQRGDFPIEYMWHVVAEESLEMLGLVLFIDALLGYLQAEPARVSAVAPTTARTS